MKILIHIHTLNDEDVIDRSMAALMEQDYPAPEILLLDNASTDGTLKRVFPKKVAIIRHEKNLGTSGAVATGFRYAMEKGYEWIWILDADSIVHKDTLTKLVDLYDSFSPEAQQQIGLISCRIIRSTTQPPEDYGLLTPKGPRPPHIDPNRPYYECDSTIWSGSLFNLRVVQEIGPPHYGADHVDDLSLDWGDVEYTFRIRHAGYKLLVHRESTIRHALGWQRQRRVLGRTIYSTNHVPFRRYLYFRNQVYFWLYLYPRPNILFVLFSVTLSLASQSAKVLFIEEADRWLKIRAMVRGFWDGVRGKIHNRY
jgi:GT2 family glycosyltransferase